MGKVFADISISLDGFVAGPAPTLADPLGSGGMQLHEWAFRLAAWRAPHGLEGGETDDTSTLVEETLAATGAVVMGRKMFSGGAGPWDADENREGWWGDDPPFHVPVFVLTRHAREPLPKQGGTSFTFVTAGLAAAVELARGAAGDRGVSIAGGADVVQQGLAAGLLDELQVHVAPVLLGSGTQLFAGARPQPLQILRTVASPFATHIRYRLDAG
jgi:dihydrofolate reductase